MIDGNAILSELIGKNWMPMVIVYAVLRAIFPNSKILTAIGDTFAERFPVFKKKEQ